MSYGGHVLWDDILIGGNVLQKKLCHGRTFLAGGRVLWDDISYWRTCLIGRYVLQDMSFWIECHALRHFFLGGFTGGLTLINLSVCVNLYVCTIV